MQQQQQLLLLLLLHDAIDSMQARWRWQKLYRMMIRVSTSLYSPQPVFIEPRRVEEIDEPCKRAVQGVCTSLHKNPLVQFMLHCRIIQQCQATLINGSTDRPMPPRDRISLTPAHLTPWGIVSLPLPSRSLLCDRAFRTRLLMHAQDYQ